MIKHVTPQDAHDLLQRGGYVYLDVRTCAEFAAGHAPAAVNIPVMETGSDTDLMFQNDNFIRVVEARFQKTDRILVGCQSGGRSLMAAQMMESEGFTNVHNVTGGYGGRTDALGQLVEKGWEALGLPVERGGEASYAALKKKAKA